jgi:hypothetical protein
MSWYFSPLAGTTGTPSATLVSYAATDWGFSGSGEIQIHGTGFTYDANGFLSGGSITSMDLVDVTVPASPAVIQTVTMLAALDGALVESYLTEAKTVADVIKSWNLPAFADPNSKPSFADTGTTVLLADNTFLKITGTGFDPTINNGHVTSIQHLAADGTTVLQHLDQAMASDVLFEDFGSSSGLYHLLVQGGNLITDGTGQTIDMTGGAGDDTLTGNANGGTADYQEDWSTGGVTVDLGAAPDHGTATGQGIGTDTLINIHRVIGSS